MAQGAHPPSLLPGSRLGEGGREGTGRGGPAVDGSLVWRRAGGSAERAARGQAAELGGEGFRNPVGAGPGVQMSSGEGRDGGGGWAGMRQPLQLRLRPLKLGVVLGPGRGVGGGRLPESLALRGSRQSCEPNNRPRRPAAAGRGLCGPAPPSPSRSPLQPVPGSRPNSPSPRHHHVPAPRPQRLRPSSPAWAPLSRVPPPSSISGCGARGWGLNVAAGSTRVAPRPLRRRRGQRMGPWPVRRCPGVGIAPSRAGVDKAPQ